MRKGGNGMRNIILNTGFGITERKGIVITNSLNVSEIFEKDHKTVIRAIENCEASEKFNRHNFTPTSYKDSQGRKQKLYEMTRDGFSFIVMGFTGKKAAQFKEAYINAFNEMESFIRNLMEAKADFPEFTDAIMLAHEEPKHYHFSNECDMINKIVTGMNAKQYREENGIEPGKSIRPYLKPSQISLLRSLQRIDIGLIHSVPDYQQRKQMLEQQFKRLQQKAISA
jgi:Rha family phage regulatory protein